MWSYIAAYVAGCLTPFAITVVMRGLYTYVDGGEHDIGVTRHMPDS